MKPIVTKHSEQSITVEMPNTESNPEIYWVFFPEVGCSEPWVKVRRVGSKWAMLNSRTHHRQISRVMAVIESAA